MKQLLKRIATAGMALALTLSLTSCSLLGGSLTTTDATAYIQGLLDETYLGVFSEDYMDMVDISRTEAEETYLNGLEVEAEYFADFMRISNLTDEIKDEIMTLYKEIYAKADYTVESASKLDDRTFAIKVRVKPLDIMHLVSEAMEDYMADFYNAYTDEEVEAMTDEEYDAYDAEWAKRVIALCYEKLPEMGYLDETSLVVQLAKDEDDVWSIPDDDFSNLDYLIIDYNI